MTTNNLSPSPVLSQESLVLDCQPHSRFDDGSLALIGRCVLTREIAIEYGLSPNETFLVQILMQGAATVATVKDKMPFEGVDKDKSTQSVLRAINRKTDDKLIEKAPEGIGYSYFLSQDLIDTHSCAIEDRQEIVQELDVKFSDWLAEYLKKIIIENTIAERTRGLYIHVLDTLIDNLGWRLRAEVLDLPSNKSKNLSRVMDKLSEIFPDGLIEKHGERNTTEYMINLDVASSLEKPDDEDVVLDSSVFDCVKECLSLDNELSIDILCVLQQFGNRRSSDIKRIIESTGKDKITKNRFYRAIKRLKDNELIEMNPDETELQDRMYSISEIDFEKYKRQAVDTMKSIRNSNEKFRKKTKSQGIKKAFVRDKDNTSSPETDQEKAKNAEDKRAEIKQAVIEVLIAKEFIVEEDVENILDHHQITWSQLLGTVDSIHVNTGLSIFQIGKNSKSIELTGYGKYALNKGNILFA